MQTRDPFARRVRVRYAETDQMGVVYYANYLVWFEVGRTDWLRDAGWTYREMEQDGHPLPVIEAHAEYRRPARYDDEIEIRTKATPLTPVRSASTTRFGGRTARNRSRPVIPSTPRWTRTAGPAGCHPAVRELLASMSE